MAELLGRACLVAVGAQAADVAVIVRAALNERHDVVRYAGLSDGTLGSAVSAERLDLQSPQTLSNGPASTQSLGHRLLLALQVSVEILV
jgi:hypothetical protein